ncbi:MAG: PaaI family thioesterase [Lentisphaeria bacterium]|nr:PaaI family thioesterase [Lentisphaeria bacterium]
MDLELLKNYINENDTFGKSNFMHLETVRTGYAEAVMSVTENSCNAVGTVQGGAIFTLADLAFAGAANSYGDKCVAMSAAVSFIRPGTGKILRAYAKEVSKGRRSCVIEVEVKNEDGKLVSKIQFTGFFYEK